MPAPDLWAPGLFLVAAAGGAFGASVGALQSFTLAGLFVVIGELYRLVGRTMGVESLPIDVTGAIAFGPVLGPHVAFGGGAAAVAYATKRGYLETDFEYHQAKEITRGLGNRPDVLAVGGLFGVLGYLIFATSKSIAAPVDPVALGVVGSALLHRVAFGYRLVGSPVGTWLDMDPTDTVRGDGGHPASSHAVEPWLPYQYRWGEVVGIGLVVGVLGGYIAYLTASPFLAFGLSVVALTFLCAGVAEIPVTHHMSLPASTAVLALVDAEMGVLTPGLVAGAMPPWIAILVGGCFGVIGALLGEVLQRVFYAHAETHLDPPAASIVLTSLLIALLAIAGVVPSSVWIPTP